MAFWGCFRSERTVFADHVKAGRTEDAIALLRRNPDLLAVADMWTGDTAVHFAASRGYLDMLTQMIDTVHTAYRERSRGATTASAAKTRVLKMLNQTNMLGRTPLLLACKRGHTAIVRLLISKGVDIWTQENTSKRTSLHYAAGNGHSRCIKALLSGNEREGVPRSRYCDVQDVWGVTPLHYAVWNRHLDAVLVLLSFGSSLTLGVGLQGPLICEAGSTALHLAAMVGFRDAVFCMLAKYHEQSQAAATPQRRGVGRPIDPRRVPDCEGALPVAVALRWRHYDVAQMLQPWVPLEVVLHGPEDEATAARLAAQAQAQALKQQLLSTIDDLEQKHHKKEEEEKDLKSGTQDTPKAPAMSALGGRRPLAQPLPQQLATARNIPVPASPAGTTRTGSGTAGSLIIAMARATPQGSSTSSTGSRSRAAPVRRDSLVMPEGGPSDPPPPGTSVIGSTALVVVKQNVPRSPSAQQAQGDLIPSEPNNTNMHDDADNHDNDNPDAMENMMPMGQGAEMAAMSAMAMARAAEAVQQEEEEEQPHYAALYAVEDQNWDDTCGICLEDTGLTMLSVLPCKHRMCANCSRGLITAARNKTAICPFCRGPIQGFELND